MKIVVAKVLVMVVGMLILMWFLSFFVLFYFNLSPIDNLFLIRLKVWTLQRVLTTRARLVTTVASVNCASLHVLPTKVMSTAVVAREEVHAYSIPATLDKAVGEDESLLPNSMDMALLLYL